MSHFLIDITVTHDTIRSYGSARVAAGEGSEVARRSKTTAINARGTPIWGINAFRSDGLSRLLDDLVDLERHGLQRKECDQVKAALEKIASRAAAIPDGSFWRRTIYKEFEAFAEIYEEWNSREGHDNNSIEHRRYALRKLRQARNSIATRIRKNQFILQNELDLMLVEGMYNALRDLTATLPEIFKNVAQAIARYESRKVSA